MLNRTTLAIWLRKRENRYMRYLLALISLCIMSLAGLYLMTALSPRYIMTLESRLSFLTPSGFKLHEIHDFLRDAQAVSDSPDGDPILVLPLNDRRTIRFKYPEVVRLGNPVALSDEITQSVDFTLISPKAHGLIQIWHLRSSFDAFIETSKEYAQINFIDFKTRTLKVEQLNVTEWDYSFKSQDKTIHALEAFFNDQPYLYRISIFFDEKDYNAHARELFDEMVSSVRVE